MIFEYENSTVKNIYKHIFPYYMHYTHFCNSYCNSPGSTMMCDDGGDGDEEEIEIEISFLEVLLLNESAKQHTVAVQGDRAGL
jgi:hypothetical protein